MKFLNTYNESRSEDIIDNLRDILLELEDIGYRIDINEVFNDKQRLIVTIRKFKGEHIVKLDINDDCREYMERLKDYIGDRAYSILVYGKYKSSIKERYKHGPIKYDEVNDIISAEWMMVKIDIIL